MSAGLTAVVGAAGGAGAVSRVLLEGALAARRVPVPYPILLVNVLGSLVLGLLTGLVLFHGAPDALRVAVGTGFCGGFTTFSTASVASVRLAQQDRPAAAALHTLGTLALTCLAAALGLALAAL